MDIYFYTMQNVRAGNMSEVKLLKKMPGIKSNQLLWSPVNGFMMIGLYGMQGSNGKFAIFNVNELEWIVPPDFVHAGGVGLQHWFFTDAEWDPTGRYLATFLTHTSKGSSNDNGYRLWSFSGKEIGLDKGKSFTPQKLFQFCWRPRPASLLSKDQVKSIIRRLKEKPEEFEKFDREDSARLAFQERYVLLLRDGVLAAHAVPQFFAQRSRRSSRCVEAKGGAAQRDARAAEAGARGHPRLLLRSGNRVCDRDRGDRGDFVVSMPSRVQ
jgi:hypothetical protein